MTSMGSCIDKRYPIRDATKIAAETVRKWLEFPVDPETASSPPNSTIVSRLPGEMADYRWIEWYFAFSREKTKKSTMKSCLGSFHPVRKIWQPKGSRRTRQILRSQGIQTEVRADHLYLTLLISMRWALVVVMGSLLWCMVYSNNGLLVATFWTVR